MVGGTVRPFGVTDRSESIRCLDGSGGEEEEHGTGDETGNEPNYTGNGQIVSFTHAGLQRFHYGHIPVEE